jgi:hypothetical protein
MQGAFVNIDFPRNIRMFDKMLSFLQNVSLAHVLKYRLGIGHRNIVLKLCAARIVGQPVRTGSAQTIPMRSGLRYARHD